MAISMTIKAQAGIYFSLCQSSYVSLPELNSTQAASCHKI